MERYTTPPLLINQARDWYGAYKTSASESSKYSLVYYTYMTAAEFWFKAEITLRDLTFGDVKKHQRLGHSFPKMLRKLEAVSPNGDETVKAAKSLAEEAHLLSLDMIDIKYPSTPTFRSLPRHIMAGEEETLNSLIAQTEAKRQEMSAWVTSWRTTHLRPG